MTVVAPKITRKLHYFGQVLRFFHDQKFLLKVQAQTSNLTIVAIEGLKIQALVTLTPPYNFLKDELDGHFFRSSTAIRLARSTLFATSSSFPYFSLTNETKEYLKGNLTYILNNCTDPTIEYLQNQALTSFFSFANNTKSPIEQALQPGFDQLNVLEDAIRSADNQTCLAAVNVNTLNLTATYANFTNGIDACTANASASYRVPIRDFVQENFAAFPVLTAMNLNLAGCRVLPFTEACVKLFLATYSGSCASM